jgi:hypothetical protein
MANAGTGHGRQGRIYFRLPGSASYALIPKLSSDGTAVSQFDIQEPNDMQEDTGQGDGNKTKVPGLGDWQASLRFFVQDASTEHIQYDLIRAARDKTIVDVLAYPLLGAGVDNFYYEGGVYLSMTSLPADVANLIAAAFTLDAAGTMTLVTPNDA